MLSKAQLNVLRLMNSGWELAARYGGYSPRAWIQKGGARHGGESKTVSFATVRALCRRNLITPKRIQGLGMETLYELASAGLAALEAEGE